MLQQCVCACVRVCVCAYIGHLGSLESTQKARVAFGCVSCDSYASFVLSNLQTSRVLNINIDVRTLSMN